MRSQIRALAWEELRVGGSTTALLIVVGVVLQFGFYLSLGELAPQRDASAYLAVVGIPILVGLLLVLTIDFSGHMTLGFSRRILRLPVPVWLPVVISLIARTAFVFASALFSIGVANWLFDDIVGSIAIAIAVMIYLALQIADWLRAPAAGLLLLTILGVVGAATTSFVALGIDLEAILSKLIEFGERGPSILLFLIPTICVACAIAVPAVHAARTGRRIRLFSVRAGGSFDVLRGASTPFRSPVTAQVWYEWRRGGWMLPYGAIGITLLAAFDVWSRSTRLGWLSFRAEDIDESLLALMPWVGILCFAAAQSLGMSISRGQGSIRYYLLRPMADSEYARARTIANGISLALAMIFGLLINAAVYGPALYLNQLPAAHGVGVASYREIVWIALSQLLLLSLLAWGTLAVSTRIGWAVSGVVTGIALIGGICAQYFETIYGDDILCAVWIVLALFTVCAYVMEWRRRVVSTRTGLGWMVAWAFSAWLAYRQAEPTISAASDTSTAYAAGIVSCFGLTSLLPLPFLAFVSDIHVKRRGVVCGQDRAQTRDPRRHALPTPLRRGLLVSVAAFAIWLGWPTAPAYETVWRERGWPVTLDELNDWYGHVPPEENLAPEILRVLQNRERLVRSLGRYEWGLVMIHGPWPRAFDEPIPADVWEATAHFQEHVAGPTAVSLQTLLGREFTGSRYPIDLSDPAVRTGPDLHSLRNVARDLHLEATYQAVMNDPGKSTEAIRALALLTKSLDPEPTLLSQLVRFSLEGMIGGTVSHVLSRSTVPEPDLRRIQATLSDAASELEGSVNLAIVGEHAMLVSMLDLSNWQKRGPLVAWPSAAVIRALLSPRQAETVESSYWLVTMHDADTSTINSIAELERRVEQFVRANPLARLPSIAMSVYPGIFEHEKRTALQLRLAASAAAIERYRVAHGVLPERLDVLVPDYLEAVPRDFYSRVDAAIRYRAGEDSAFVVYSVGPDGDDDMGHDTKHWIKDGDMILRIPALSVRLGEQITDVSSEPVD